MKLIRFFVVLFVGIFIGWQARNISAPQSVVVVREEAPEDVTEELTSERLELNGNPNEIITPKTDTLESILARVNSDLTTDERNQLNQHITSLAKKTVAGADSLENIETVMFQLSVHFDTRSEVLNLLAKYYRQQQRYQKMLDVLYDVKELQHFPSDRKRIDNLITHAIREQLNLYSELESEKETLDFYQYIIGKEPDNYQRQLWFAKQEFTRQNYEQVVELLEVVRYHPDYTTEATKLFSKAKHQLDNIREGTTPILMSKFGEHYIVDAIINDSEPVKLIIDTGATMTVISPAIAHNLGISEADVVKYMSFNTANGIVKAPVISVEKLEIQNYNVVDIQVGVLSSFTRENIDGLLGMNFLSNFTFFIDQENNMLELTSVESM